jgi:NAD(P)-dependent dehydrogenase (short-subunit alcohol dehydrogenase family)
MTDMKNRVVLVTRAASGLGRAYALWPGRRGARVVANNRVHPDRLHGAAEVVRAIRETGGEAVVDNHTAGTPGAGEGMIRTAIDTFGRIDAVIANAAANRARPASEIDLPMLREAMEINFWGSVEPVMAALPHMIAKDYGRIVITSSAAALFGQRGHLTYACAKMALTGFSRVLAIDTAKLNIRVNALSPMAHTQMTDAVLPETMHALMVADRVAPVAGWLASEACDVTGQIFVAGAGRLRRDAIVEGPRIMIEDDNVAAAIARAMPLDTITEPRNSGHATVDLIPELKESA